ncbi:glycoside hydrolase family 125 protein [Xylariaceae sp. FL0804]|nr:glycoside hydrolase family 125 protein [Xylariaceae sp. FL0804]
MDCPSYTSYSQQPHEPYSAGVYRLGSMRPPPGCRTFNSTAVEAAIEQVVGRMRDPDLARLFENAFPNTLDAAVKWRGAAADDPAEELAFVITGDIDAMWLRDSANQVAPYRSVLQSSPDDDDDELASLFRGVLNLQARYLTAYPYCNAFLPPPEAGLNADHNGATYQVRPAYDRAVVFTCNFELDDFGAFLQLSHDYYTATGDVDFFGRSPRWAEAVRAIVAAADALRAPTYGEDGDWVPPVYSFQSETMTSFGTLGNNGMNYPVNRTGMVRSPFRPNLEATSDIMEKLPNAPQNLTGQMRDMASEIRAGIEQWGIITSPTGQKMYAYEVDGFGGQNLMDDANIPSLLSAPMLGYLDANDTVYQNTRQWILSRQNPWWCSGTVLNAVGSPHIRPGAAWPMAAIVRAMTSDDDDEITTAIKEVLSSTNGLGLIHESVSSFDASQWTRSWFGWGNAVFGQMIMELAERKPHLLEQSFQPLFIDRN